VTVYWTVVEILWPLLSVAMTVKLVVPGVEVLMGWPFATVPLQTAIGLVIPPSLHLKAARAREPRLYLAPVRGELTVIVGIANS
jgi:hypothetical protein